MCKLYTDFSSKFWWPTFSMSLPSLTNFDQMSILTIQVFSKLLILLQVTPVSKCQQNTVLSIFECRHDVCMCSKLMINSPSKENSEPKHYYLWLPLHSPESAHLFYTLKYVFFMRLVPMELYFPEFRNTQCGNHLF